MWNLWYRYKSAKYFYFQMGALYIVDGTKQMVTPEKNIASARPSAKVELS
jgi:predicted phage tail protein